jgi:hypothetical protein
MLLQIAAQDIGQLTDIELFRVFWGRCLTQPLDFRGGR